MNWLKVNELATATTTTLITKKKLHSVVSYVDIYI